MFQHLASLAARGVTIKFEVSKADGDKLEVNVYPVCETGKSGFNLVPKSFVATPEEFDADFATIMQGYCTTNVSLREQLAAVDVMAEQTAKAASEAAASVKPASGVKRAIGKAPTKPAAPSSSDNDDADGAGDEDEDSSNSGTSGTPLQGASTGGPSELPFTL